MTEGSRLDQAIAMGVPGDAIDFSAMAGITFQDTMLLTTYDHTLGALFEVRRRGPWWVVDVEANRHRLIRPEPRTAPTRPETTSVSCTIWARGTWERAQPSPGPPRRYVS